MLRSRFPLALALALVASLATSGATASSQNAASSLSPPAGSPHPGASGEVRLKKNGAHQEFQVTAEAVPCPTPVDPVDVLLESGVGTETFFTVASMEFEAGADRWVIDLDATGAAPAELGVADLSELAGRKILVQTAVATDPCLGGFVPPIGSSPGSNGAKKAEVALQRPDPAPDADAFGKAKLAKKGNRQEFKVEAGNLPAGPGDAFRVWLEDAVGSGVYFLVGDMALESAPSGTWELNLQSQGGAPAPLGVADVGALAGRRVQVRDALDAVYLWGTLPALAQAPGLGNVNRKANLSPPPGGLAPSPDAKGWVRVRYIAPKGRSRLEVVVQRGLTSGSSYGVWIEDAVGAGTFTQVGDLSLDASGTKGRFRRDTKSGQTLPLGAATVLDYSGRKIEIRDAALVVFLEGVIP
jgi:hypothetical protein